MKKLTQEQIEMLELWMNNPDAEWEYMPDTSSLWHNVVFSEQMPRYILNGTKYRIKPKTKTVYFALMRVGKCISITKLQDTKSGVYTAIGFAGGEIIGDIESREVEV